jgi:hypothetical protein
MVMKDFILQLRNRIQMFCMHPMENAASNGRGIIIPVIIAVKSIDSFKEQRNLQRFEFRAGFGSLQ